MDWDTLPTFCASDSVSIAGNFYPEPLADGRARQEPPPSHSWWTRRVGLGDTKGQDSGVRVLAN